MRSRLAAACLTGGLLAALPTPTVAVSAIPDETSAELSGGARSAIVGDVDGDGVRELVVIRRWENDPGRLAVEVTYIDEAGQLMSGGQVLLRRKATADDLDAGPQPDDEEMLMVGAAEPARLLAWRVNGVERVIVAAAGTEGLVRPTGPTLWIVGRDQIRGTELRLLYDTQAAGNSIRAIDLDGDGTDELVITEPPELIRPSEVEIHILRWDGRSFDKLSFFLAPALGSDFAPIGNSDGRPGDELGVIAVPNEGNIPALLHRISLRTGGLPHTETVSLPFVGELAAFAGSGGSPIVLASPGEGVRLFDWPVDSELTELATSPQRGFPLGVLGTGDHARLLLRDEGVVHVLDEGLAERGVIRRSDAAARFRNSLQAPFGGMLPGGLADGSPAIVFRGRLVSAADVVGPDGDPLRQSVVAALPGISPIGTFGPDGASMALAAATSFDAERGGGRMTAEAPIEPVRVTVVSTDDVLSPEADAGALEPTVIGAIPDPRSPARAVLLARDAFFVELTGPHGSEVAYEDRAGVVSQVRIGARGVARLTIEPPSVGTVDESFSAGIQVVTPAGHGYVARWEVHILREPPPMSATTPIAPLSFSVPVRGRTDPGTTVLVDGVPVAVGADGSFDSHVTAGPIPRDVRIQVTDLVGNSSQHIVSVVGFVDFRRLPWIPVVAVLTILAGVVLYLRVPRPTRPAARRAGDDATFEEID